MTLKEPNWSLAGPMDKLEELVKYFQSGLKDGTVKIEKLCGILSKWYTCNLMVALRNVDVETSFKNQEITPNALIQMACDEPEVFFNIASFTGQHGQDLRTPPGRVPPHLLTLSQAIQLSKAGRYWTKVTCYVLAVLKYTNRLEKDDPIIQELIPLDENKQRVSLFDLSPPTEEAIDALFSLYQAKAGLSARLEISAKWELAKRELELKSF
jgi:hypothetical protein